MGLIHVALAGLIVASVTSATELSCGKLFYRTLHLDEEKQSLYVGAMDRLIRIENLANISHTNCERDSMILEANNVASCVSRGKSEDFDCRNHIRVIQPIDDKRLYICGTNAHSPEDQVVYANLTHLARHEFYPGIGNGVAKCPFDPEDNSTATWVRSGNPGGHPAIYSGTNAEFTKADAVIFRGDIFDENTGRREFTFKRTIKYDSHMLDKPDFVGSYEVGDYVYFFFRETAVEYMNCGKTIYSRIARVCKRDTGGKNILHQNWATYLKARLNCSIAGDFPFFFNEIQDVFKPSYDDTTFHAVFSTSQNGLQGSAICSFRLDDVDKVFSGKFKEQSTSTSMWLPVPSANVPEPRPGACVKDTRDLPDTVLNFIRKHSLMDTDVPHDAAGPAFYQRDVTFTKVVVDNEVTVSHFGSQSQEYTIYFAGTNDGRIFKVARWPSRDGLYKSRLLDIINVTAPEPIRAMVISRELKMLYVSSDSSIQQIDIRNRCIVGHSNCVECVRDPHCGWNRELGKCSHFAPHLIQDPQGEIEGVCEASLNRQKVEANFGSAIHLDCALGNADKVVEWYHYNIDGKRRRITESEGKFVFTQDKGLVVIGVGDRDIGQYDCRVEHETISSYKVAVDFQRCSAPDKSGDYQKAYSQWCNEFQKYRTALNMWEKKKHTCPPQSLVSNTINQQQSSMLQSNPFY
jgi:hypothetical protein